MSAVEPIIKILDDSEYYVRLVAIRTLGNLKDSRAVEPLLQLIEDEDEDSSLRNMAQKALKGIGD